MRKVGTFVACALLTAVALQSPVRADGFTDKKPWAVRQPNGPTDGRLVGKEPTPSANTTAKPGAPAKMDAAPNIAPPAAPQAVEEAAPTTPIVTHELDGNQSVQPQSLAGDGSPIWSNRWFWALLALLLLATAGGVEYFGRKRDERLAADEPDDAPIAV